MCFHVSTKAWKCLFPIQLAMNLDIHYFHYICISYPVRYEIGDAGFRMCLRILHCSTLKLIRRQPLQGSSNYCLAKAVHSLARIRTANCPSVRPSVRVPLVSNCPQNRGLGRKILKGAKWLTLCETQLSAEDRSFVQIYKSEQCSDSGGRWVGGCF